MDYRGAEILAIVICAILWTQEQSVGGSSKSVLYTDPGPAAYRSQYTARSANYPAPSAIDYFLSRFRYYQYGFQPTYTGYPENVAVELVVDRGRIIDWRWKMLWQLPVIDHALVPCRVIETSLVRIFLERREVGLVNNEEPDWMDTEEDEMYWADAMDLS